MSVHGELELQRTNGAALEQNAPAEVSIAQIIEKISQTPSLTLESIGVLERLVALQERRDEQSRKERFFEALARVQALAPRITKHGVMTRGATGGTIKYAKREDIDAIMRPIYQNEGFSVNWDSPMVDGKIRVIGRFTAFGHTEQREWWCAPDSSGGKQPPQASGSTVSYGQRYISVMFWDIITEDEDKNGAKRQDVEPITQSQADDVRSQLEEIKADMGRFNKLFGVTKLEELKAGQLKEVHARIKKAREKR